MSVHVSSKPADEASRLPAAAWLVLGIVLVAEVMDLLDSTITTIAAPTISSSLHGGPGLIKWLGASYALALGVLLVTAGLRRGKRRRTTDSGRQPQPALHVHPAYMAADTCATPGPAQVTAREPISDAAYDRSLNPSLRRPD
jgi:hypothetical protein